MASVLPLDEILDPDQSIVDAHHHLWLLPDSYLAGLEAADTEFGRLITPTMRSRARYLWDEFLVDLNSGHKICATVHVDAHTMYRADGPEPMKSVGEVEFVNGIAAMAASGIFGRVAACAAIVGGIDFRLGRAVQEVLEAHIQAAGGRYRGVRSSVIVPYDEDVNILGMGVPQLLLDRGFRAGFSALQPLGLSFDVWLFEPQLPELIDLARTFPDTQIVLEHLGTPLGVGRYRGHRSARFPIWRERIRTLATCQNVVVKLGGLGSPFGGFKSYRANPPASSEQLAQDWKPYIETCIEAFGADRCMFESNFPVDSAVGTYAVLWNTFKRLTIGASEAEKHALFCGTAERIYSLSI